MYIFLSQNGQKTLYKTRLWLNYASQNIISLLQL